MINFLRYLWVVSIMGVSIISPVKGHAQQLSKEPAGGMDADAVLNETKSLPPSSGMLPTSMNIAPLNTLYKSWDTICVRRYADPVENVNEPIVLPLVSKPNEFVFPRQGQLLSPFGYRGRRVHSGVDIKLNLYDSVSSAFDGVVRMARYYHGYGNCVVVRHYNGLETLYGHLSKIKVRVNQEVKAGDLVGLGGSTGRATCNHLHFETRFRGQAFNPKQLIDFDNFSLLQDTLVITRHTFGRSRDYIPSGDQLLASTSEKNDYSESRVRSSNDSKKSLHSKKSKSSSHSRKYHTVKPGDTLYSISKKNGKTVKELCAMNGIKSTKVLKLGSKIRIR